MPPERCSSQEAFDTNLLDTQVLDGPNGLQTALRTFEAACYRGDPEIAGIVTVLNSRSHILEYTISGMLRISIGPCELPIPIILPFSVG